MRRFSSVLRKAGGYVSRYRIAIASACAVLVVLLVAPVVLVTVAPGSLFGRYHDVAANYEDMGESRHAEVDCVACHTSRQGRVVYSVALVGDFYASIVSPTDEPRFLEFETPSREACLACHETAWSKEMERIARVPHPAHMRVADETRQCVQCHKWTAHEEVYMQEHKEMPFSGICVAYGCHSGFRSEDECTSCHHALRDEPENWRVEHAQVSYEIGTNACLEFCHDANQCRLCHTTGERPVFDGLRTRTGLEDIERLHVAEDWSETHGPVALEDQSKCMQCHVSDGECRACHERRPASHDPAETWIRIHQERVPPDDEVRCMTCHERSWCDECHALFEESG